MSKEASSRKRQPGQGKVGRMNAIGPLMRLRDIVVTETAYTVMNGVMVLVGVAITRTDTQLPQQRRHPPQSFLTHAERSNPNEVSEAVGPRVGQPRGKRNPSVGTGRTLLSKRNREADGLERHRL